jgi:hypothetical protein
MRQNHPPSISEIARVERKNPPFISEIHPKNSSKPGCRPSFAH